MVISYTEISCCGDASDIRENLVYRGYQIIRLSSRNCDYPLIVWILNWMGVKQYIIISEFVLMREGGRSTVVVHKDCRSKGRAIDPAPGACFILNSFISPSCPWPSISADLLPKTPFIHSFIASR